MSEYIKKRMDWLGNEARNGGDRAHLSARIEEASYLGSYVVELEARITKLEAMLRRVACCEECGACPFCGAIICNDAEHTSTCKLAALLKEADDES